MHSNINYDLILPIESPDIPDDVRCIGMKYDSPACFVVTGPEQEYTLFTQQGTMLDIVFKDA